MQSSSSAAPRSRFAGSISVKFESWIVNSSIKPRRNIAVGGPALDGNEALYVQECQRTNSISSVGRFVADFERKFAEFCSVRHAISTCNGTCALHLALIALGLKPGDEVIVPTLTYVATANVVRYCGGRPVLVDVDRTTFNIDPAKLEAYLPTLALERGESVQMPPVIYLQGTEDVAHPVPNREHFIANYRKAGGRVELHLFKGVGEAFMTSDPTSPASLEAVDKIIAFVHREIH